VSFEEIDSILYCLFDKKLSIEETAGKTQIQKQTVEKIYSLSLKSEQNRALEVFDASKLISELPNSFGYHFESNERIDDKMKQQMLIQEQKAKEHLEKTYLQARW